MSQPFDTTGSSGVQFHDLGFENFDWNYLGVVAGRMTIAALLGACVAFRVWRRFMRWHFEPTEAGAQVLISASGAMMVGVITTTALAFTLVGLGGFIRFRSGIKDPREAGVMFLMIGIGMAAGIGAMPIALTATVFGIVLLSIMDYTERYRRQVGMRRLRFTEIPEPHTVEPALLEVIAVLASVRSSRVRPRAQEIIIDVFSDGISAGQIIQAAHRAGIAQVNDVLCEEL